jgi:hypothetical protein
MIFKRKLAQLERRATHSDVRAMLLLAAMRAFREAERQPAEPGATSREHLLIADFAEPVVVPLPLCNRGG